MSLFYSDKFISNYRKNGSLNMTDNLCAVSERRALFTITNDLGAVFEQSKLEYDKPKSSY